MAALGLAACDGVDPLPLTNPYDPLAGSQGYEVTGPVDLRLMSATPTSAVLEWTDRSGGVASYELRERFGAEADTDSVLARLPAGTTAHTLDGLTRLSDRRLVVVGTFPDGRQSRPTNVLTLRYPRDEFTIAMPERPLTADFSSDGQMVFVGFYGFMNAYALSGDPAAEYTIRRWYTIPLIGPNGDVGLVAPDGDDPYHRIWSLGRGGAVAGAELAGAIWSCGKFAASRDGSRIAGQCVEDGDVAFVVWDAASGQRVEEWSGSGALGDLSALASEPDVALFQLHGHVRGVSPSGEASWSIDTFGVEWVRVAVDGSRAAIAYESPDFYGTKRGVIRTYDLPARRVLAERVGMLFGSPLDTRHGLVAYHVFTPFSHASSGVNLAVRIASSATLETIRDVPWGDRSVVGMRLTESGLLVFLDDGTTARWDFARSWEAVPPDA